MNSDTDHVLFRCDGSSAIGLGHVMRCLALAGELRREHGIVSGFALRSDETGTRMIQRYGFPVFLPAAGTRHFDYGSWLCDLASETQAGVVVLDVRDNPPAAALDALRKSSILTVTIDDPSPTRLHVDMAFYPPVPQVDRMDWTQFKGRLFKGWDWIPLRKEISDTPVRAQPDHVQSLLITMGGADPAGMTMKVVKLLNALEKPFKTVAMAGPAFQRHRALEKAAAESSRDIIVEKDADRLPELMAEADLAITSFGVTAYELAAVGVPAAYLCLTPDHQESASLFAREGMGLSLGLFTGIDGERFLEGISPLLQSLKLRESMSLKGRKTVDGQGAKRISNLIVEHLRKQREDD